MPKYDYICPANGQTVEVSHPMKDKVSTWGDLCARAGVDPGKTPAAAPVERLVSAGNVSVPGGKESGGGGGHTCGHGCGHHH